MADYATVLCLLYIKSDATVAPPGNENILILIPVAVGLEDNDAIREKYFDQVIKRLEILLEKAFALMLYSKEALLTTISLRIITRIKAMLMG